MARDWEPEILLGFENPVKQLEQSDVMVIKVLLTRARNS